MSSPADLGFVAVAAAEWPDDVFVEDDVGAWRCRDCHRSTAEVDEQGHAPGCAQLKRISTLMPKGQFRRRVVGEWPGLRDAILIDHDLRANLLAEVTEAYRTEWKLAAGQRHSVGHDVRKRNGQAFAALAEHLKALAPMMSKLFDLSAAAGLWWLVVDRIDGRGRPPKRRKKQ